MAILRHHQRRIFAFLGAILFIIYLVYSHAGAVTESSRTITSNLEEDGFGDSHSNAEDQHSAPPEDAALFQPKFKPGKPGPPGTKYTQTLVVPRLMRENVDWIEEQLPDIGKAIYVVDLQTAPLHPPKNKGHEVMIYLTYIIDNYDSLPDVSIFMHSHRYTWHNNALLDNDAVAMIKALSNERVIREGYMNMRCTWYPGCPEWMHPGTSEVDEDKLEEVEMANSWSELFPEEPVPDVVAQPCCSQFALSRERILSRPLNQYVSYRDWLLKTPLSDYLSGRIFEYSWQYLFTGSSVFCPKLSACYCDGFGYCFGSEQAIQSHFLKRERLQYLDEKYHEWIELDRVAKEALKESENGFDELANVVIPEPGKDKELKAKVERLEKAIEQEAAEALERGKDPRARAKEAGRDWKEGDGF